MKQNIIIVIGVVTLVVILFIILSSRNSQNDIKQSDFDKLSAITLVDYEGNDVSLERFIGKPLVINSWAVWCPFCRKELVDFAELQKEFVDQIIVIAIDRQEPLKEAKGYTDEIGVTDDMLFLLDSKDSFYKSIGGFSMPETVFINASGDIVVHKRGPMELDEMREHTRKIISDVERAQ